MTAVGIIEGKDSNMMNIEPVPDVLEHYQQYVDQIIALEQPYSLVLHQWLPDRQNKGAHHLAQQALKK